MASKENAAASLGKVDPSPLLQHLSTFSLRRYCSVVYWQSCGGGAGILKQTTFLNVGKPKSMRDFEENVARWLAFHGPYARSQAKTGCEGPSLFSTRNKISQWRFLQKVWTRRNVSPLNTVGTLLLLLPLLLLLLLCEAKDSLPTKNFVELRSNDVGTTAGERGLIPGLITRKSLNLYAVAYQGPKFGTYSD